MQTRTAVPLFLAIIALCTVCGAASVWAQAGQAKAAAKGDPEVIEDADVAEVRQPAAAQKGIADLFGRFHPPLVHLPIAWLLLMLIIDGGTFVLGRPWERAGYYVLMLAAASCVPAVMTGLLREECVKGSPEFKAIVPVHKWLAVTTMSLTLLALIIRVSKKNKLEKASKYAYLSIIFAAGLLVGIVGHKGGQLVFGKDFLPF